MPQIDPTVIARVTRQFPELAAVPERERLPLLLRARRQPAVLATFFGLLLVWLCVCGPGVIAVTGHLHGRALFLHLLLPVFVPLFVIFLVSRQVLRRTLRKLAAQRPTLPPTLPTPPL